MDPSIRSRRGLLPTGYVLLAGVGLFFATTAFRCPGPAPSYAPDNGGAGGGGGTTQTVTSTSESVSGTMMSSSTGPCTANIDSDPANCGACGRACSPLGTVNLDCMGGLCLSSCVPGRLNVIQPPAPFPDDGCETPVHRVFVTSLLVLGNMNGMAGGAQAADTICQQVATAAGIVTPTTFRAWISDHNSSPLTRFAPGPGVYKLMDGTPVAGSFAELTSGTLGHAIDMDENMMPATSLDVWTGTAPNGTGSLVLGFNGQPQDFCADWTIMNSDVDTTVIGNSSNTDGTWTESPNATNCFNTGTHLYCFEQ